MWIDTTAQMATTLAASRYASRPAAAVGSTGLGPGVASRSVPGSLMRSVRYTAPSLRSPKQGQIGEPAHSFRQRGRDDGLSSFERRAHVTVRWHDAVGRQAEAERRHVPV